jgi:glycosyltransferase involved in cell wall biosynthesis
MLSMVIPVYRNAESLPALIAQLSEVSAQLKRDYCRRLQAVFVVDGSPDESHEILERLLANAPFESRLMLHARNFGAFAAIRTGLAAADGEHFVVIAADLQEPSDLAIRFLEKLNGGCDVVVGTRQKRDDPWRNQMLSKVFWRSYKRFINPEVPVTGVDVFGCNRIFRDELVKLEERNTSLIGLMFWLGFRREEVQYSRLPRSHGSSAWSFAKKFDYFLDSVFSFTDLPIRLLSIFGLFGIIVAVLFGIIVLLAKLVGQVAVPGYAATVLTIIFFGGLNSLGLGIVGAYAWRTFENTKGRPLAVVMRSQSFQAAIPDQDAL